MHCCYGKIPKSSIIGDAISKSTFHGLPRIVATSSTFVRIFWIVLLCVCLTMFSLHLNELSKKFWSEGIVTSTNLQGLHFKFPDIFICHKVPLAQSMYLRVSTANRSDSGESEKMYTRFEISKKQLTNSFNLVDNLVKDSNFTAEYAQIMPDEHFFWETVELKEILRLLGHQSYQTVTTVTVRSGHSVNVTESVSIVPNPIYTYCFVIRVPVNKMDPMDQHVHFSVFTDEDEDIGYKELLRKLGVNVDFRHGLRIYFGESNSTPSFESQFIHIRPGFFYDMRLEMEVFIRYDARRRSCLKHESKFVNLLFPDQEIALSDMYEACLMSAKQDLMVKQCGCYDIYLTEGWITNKNMKGHPACFNLTEIFGPNTNLSLENLLSMPSKYDLVLRRFQCAIKFRHTYPKKELQRMCQNDVPCTSVRYLPEWSFMEWPASEDAIEALDRTVKEPKLDREDQGLAVPGLAYQLDRLNNSKVSTTIVNNMRGTISMIKVRPSEFFSTVITERLQYPLINFFSDVGGILGLYVGASVLTIFEFFEIFFNFMRTVLIGQKEKSLVKKGQPGLEDGDREEGEANVEQMAGISSGYDNSTYWI